jgi:hypothetical protein
MISNFNLDNWPIVYFRSINNTVNDETFEEFKKYYLNLLIRCKNNNEKMVLICDLNRLTSYPLEYVTKQAQFSKQIYKFNKEYLKCVCIICKDKNFKNILNLFFTFVKPASPYKLCRSYDKVNKYLLTKFNISFDSNIFDDNINNNIINDETEEIEEEEEQYKEDNIENIYSNDNNNDNDNDEFINEKIYENLNFN